MEIKIGIKKTLNGYCAWFKIGVQTFSLQERDTMKEAQWYAEQLDTAFLNFYKDTIRSTGTFLREDLNPDFLKTIDKINENLK